MAIPLAAVILAAGDSKRMNSKTPLALLPVAGQPMIEYSLQNAEALSPDKIFVVVGPHSKEVSEYLGKRAKPVLQKQNLGSGHAVQQVLPYLKSFKGNVIVFYADDCLTRRESVLALRQIHLLQQSTATLLTARIENPFRYGRIVRGPNGDVEGIVEEDQATDEIRRIKEVNAGVYLFQAPFLSQALKSLEASKAKKEFYITESIAHLVRAGGKVQALMMPDRTEVLGISNRGQLSWAHRILNLRRVLEHQQKGVTFLNPKSVEVSRQTVIGRDTVIEGNVKLTGDTVIGEDCRIESGSVVHSSRLGRGVTLRSSRIMDSQLADGCDAGPFAHVRGGCVLDKSVHVGTNTERKNARVGAESKMGHFSYVGDAVLGRDVNVGAGCVFANFDGKNKHESRIGNKVFLGSNSTLVAPVTIGDRAVIGAGAVVTKNVPAGVTVVGVPAKPFQKKK